MLVKGFKSQDEIDRDTELAQEEKIKSIKREARIVNDFLELTGILADVRAHSFLTGTKFPSIVFSLYSLKEFYKLLKVLKPYILYAIPENPINKYLGLVLKHNEWTGIDLIHPFSFEVDLERPEDLDINILCKSFQCQINVPANIFCTPLKTLYKLTQEHHISRMSDRFPHFHATKKSHIKIINAFLGIEGK